jgi:hypothetical protein
MRRTAPTDVTCGDEPIVRRPGEKFVCAFVDAQLDGKGQHGRRAIVCAVG